MTRISIPVGPWGRFLVDAARWLNRICMGEVRQRVAERLSNEDDKRVRLWMRVTLAGERMSDVPANSGYRNDKLAQSVSIKSRRQEPPGHLLAASRDVERNPLTAGLIRRGSGPKAGGE